MLGTSWDAPKSFSIFGLELAESDTSKIKAVPQKPTIDVLRLQPSLFTVHGLQLSG